MTTRNSIYPFSILVIFLGLLLLLDNFGVIPGVYKFWPFLPLFLGGGFLMLYNNRRRKNIAFIAIGSYIMQASILFFYCNFTSWYSLAYLWPLFIGFGGSSLLVSYFFKRHRVILFVGLMLAILCATFMLVFSLSSKLWPVSLILFGASLFTLKRYDSK
ncbi:hypothetical protein HN419_04400 [Candidatus Woesearchaeota archaeon]|jgi:hypothetical protein|nr:hypothetical protein [Candidatus Woesearchaeota archaeon]MBT3537881.1 hypothetical protein [Candidatus Woesearchaeota archaeon]MBT4698012.1 hypothetical protein [Candidatus Woesearchaeota archaeon]MBT4716601.1 hypothetical protein [Candidatus Woesearchaeota archaeon]MBT7105550.1 hypothetical protein [Candidatus Woesearchaeota archaeon]